MPISDVKNIQNYSPIFTIYLARYTYKLSFSIFMLLKCVCTNVGREMSRF